MQKKKVLLISCVIILVCVSVIAGVTYALFSENKTVNTHLQAGKLDISLERTSLEYAVLNSNGELETKTDMQVVDFTGNVSGSVFGIDAQENKIVPGSYFKAAMEIGNDGNAAFTYNIKLVLGDDSTTALAQQIEVTLYENGNAVTTKKLSELTDGFVLASGSMTANDAAKSFAVKVEFVNGTSNNAAQNGDVYFDLIVEATQKTAE